MPISEYDGGMARSATTTDAFSAVAEASRRHLLEAIGTGEATVGELVDRVGLTQPQVSKHLAVLREVGLVTVRVDGKHRRYRVNGAAAALVWEAYTTPALVQRWWGFADDEWLVCDIDLRVGGTWRYVTVHRNEQATFEVGFHGEYREVVAPRRLVSTEVFEGMPDAEALDSIVFDEVDGVTTLTMRVTHSCQEHRDGHIASGMEGGMQISMDRLEDLVTS